MKRRLKNLKRMAYIMSKLDNKEAYDIWTVYVPDQPTEKDLIELAEDIDEYDDIVSLFIKLVFLYSYDGIIE